MKAGQAGIRPSRAAFTLIELLAVITVLAILMVILVSQLTGSEDAVKRGTTKTFLGQLGNAIEEYSNEFGDYPPSSLGDELGGAPNALNLGAEGLYLALCAEGSSSFGLFDDRLENTDGDALARRPKGFETPDLFEIADEWGNPIAYFHHRDYDRKDTYVTLDPATGEELESPVLPQKNPQTKRWYNPTGFQLISAGADGRFGPDESGEVDDVYNWRNR
jgi:prepilin-type N-terminal cleavage/methylation domain-containing protein